jgi:poly-gamma-glutamate capsule biosynthesis protein CapA/YwtB (metallophosphatase superfamily)
LDENLYHPVKPADRPKAEERLTPLRLLAVILLCEGLHACVSRPPTVRLALVGDIVLGRGVHPNASSLSYLEPDLSAADLALANLESPLAPLPPPSESAYNLCAPAARASLLTSWSLDLVSLANNHELDCGTDGPSMTRSALDTVGITPLGPGIRPVYREVHGLHLAFLAFDDVSSPLDVRAATQAVLSAARNGAVVIIAIHWGEEFQGGASERQLSLAQQLATAGAALIWGTHPHVLQPAAWIHTGQRKTLVLYSLGNALFDQEGLADTRRSALVSVVISVRGVQSAQIVPFMIDPAHSRVIEPDPPSTEKIRSRINLP